MTLEFADGQEVILQLPGGIYRGEILRTEKPGEWLLSVPEEGNPIQRIDNKTKVRIIRE